MNSPRNKLPWSLGVGLLLLFLTVMLLLLMAGLTSSRVGVTGDLTPKSQVSGFRLVNQSGSTVTGADLEGVVWVGDIIFTRCPGPCERMTRRMKELEEALPARSRARLVTLTTDPEFDTPEVLRRYAERFNADHSRWMFLTGSKEEIVRVAVDGLKLTAIETAPEQRASPGDLFIHSTTFVVVDGKGQLRGIYETEGEGVEWPVQKRKILAAVKALEREK